MVKFMTDSGLDAAYGDLVYVDPDDSDRITRFWKTGEYKERALYYGWAIPHPTFFCRKNVLEKHGCYNKDFQIAADFEIMLRLIEKHRIKIGYLPEVIVKMRTGGRANVLRGMICGNREIIRSFRLNDLRFSPLFFVVKPITKIAQLLRRPGKLSR